MNKEEGGGRKEVEAGGASLMCAFNSEASDMTGGAMDGMGEPWSGGGESFGESGCECHDNTRRRRRQRQRRQRQRPAARGLSRPSSRRRRRDTCRRGLPLHLRRPLNQATTAIITMNNNSNLTTTTTTTMEGSNFDV